MLHFWGFVCTVVICWCSLKLATVFRCMGEAVVLFVVVSSYEVCVLVMRLVKREDLANGGAPMFNGRIKHVLKDIQYNV